MYKRWGLLGVVAILFTTVIFLRFLNISDYISIDLFKRYRVELAQTVHAHYISIAAWYVLAYALVAAAALPFATFLTLLGGFLFGTIAGTMYTNIGATIGSIALFVLVRYVVGDYVQERYKDQLIRFNAEFNENGFFYLLSVRLFAIVPFFVVNICAGLTQATMAQFVTSTILGITPASLVLSYAGTQLAHIDIMADIFSWQILIVFILFGFISLLPVIFKKMFGGKKV